MLLNALNDFSYVPGVLGSHGFMVFMVSFVLFVSTLVALTGDVVLTNAKGGSRREDGKEKYTERERERTRKRDRQNRHRGDSNPCGQSPMDFESIPLTARAQCLVHQQRSSFSCAHDVGTTRGSATQPLSRLMRSGNSKQRRN